MQTVPDFATLHPATLFRVDCYHFSFEVRTSSSNDQARSGWR